MEVASKKLQHGSSMTDAGCPSSFGFGLEEGHVPTFWPLLFSSRLGDTQDIL